MSSFLVFNFKVADHTQHIKYLVDTLHTKALSSVANYCVQALDDDAKIDSSDSTICAKHQDVMKAACLVWNNSSEAVRKYWKLQAEF